MRDQACDNTVCKAGFERTGTPHDGGQFHPVDPLTTATMGPSTSCQDGHASTLSTLSPPRPWVLAPAAKTAMPLYIPGHAFRYARACACLPVCQGARAVYSISFAPPHVRCTPMGVHRTCGEPDETKKHTRPKNITARVRDQANAAGSSTDSRARRSAWVR